MIKAVSGKRLTSSCFRLQDQPFRFGLGCELLELNLQRVVLCLLACDKARQEACLLLDAFGREQVGVGAFVVAAAEALRSDPAALDEGAYAVVGPPEADAERVGELALTGLGVGLQVLEDAVVEFVVQRAVRA